MIALILANAGYEVVDYHRAELPPLFVVFAGDSFAGSVVGEDIARPRLDESANVLFERLFGCFREIALIVRKTAVVERVGIEIVVGDYFTNETQGELLNFGQDGIEERCDLRGVILDVDHALGLVLHAGFPLPCRAPVGGSLSGAGHAHGEYGGRDGHFQVPFMCLVEEKLEVVPTSVGNVN